MSDQPAEISGEYAEWFGVSKRQLLADAPKGLVHQVGGAYLPGEISLPDAAHLADPLCASGETLIETFMISADGLAEPTGTDTDFIQLWQPVVTEVVARIRETCDVMGIAQADMSYLTASVTPASEVIGLPHFDDGQFIPDDGVGLVAIVGDIAGSRIAVEPIRHMPTQPGLPLEVSDDVIDEFFAGHIAQQHTEANRIVVFPQFAQLHSGPQLIGGDADRVRCMLVYRTTTQAT